MGKGDIKTRRGKIQAGSFGKVRPRKKVKTAAPATAASAEKKAPKKAAKKAAK